MSDISRINGLSIVFNDFFRFSEGTQNEIGRLLKLLNIYTLKLAYLNKTFYICPTLVIRQMSFCRLIGNPVGIRNSARYCDALCDEKYLTPLSARKDGKVAFQGLVRRPARVQYS